MVNSNEKFISVDIETSGPIPNEYSMLSIGACLVEDQSKTFYIELIPTSSKFIPDAMKVNKLSLDDLHLTGVKPNEAMIQFEDWVKSLCKDGEKPIFVGFNAAFDWSFINYYFHKYIDRNPFGVAPLDIKSMFLGAYKGSWRDTRYSEIKNKLKPTKSNNHNALIDAQAQAEIFSIIANKIV